LGPACELPMCIQFFRPRATGHIEFSARLLLSSSSGYSKRVSFFHSASAYWQALLSALEGKAADCAASIKHAPAHRSKKESVKHPGRQELPANLPRVERILPCALDQRMCKRCGKETVVIGYEESSQLDVEPAKYFVLVTKREKRAWRSCEELGVVSATLPPRIIEKCLASDRIVIDTVVGKYCNHTPLYRQSMILERDLGLEISRATLDGWILKVGELLIPMVAAMRRELISGSYIQADETPVDVQMREGRGKNHQAYLWQYDHPGGCVVFDFRLGRGRDGPKRFLGQFEGILQTDGYAAYDQIGGPRMVHSLRIDFSLSDCAVGTQSPANPIGLPGDLAT
jgi:transposase